MTAHISNDRINQAILLIRKHRVMLDTDLAKLYGVPTKVLKPSCKKKRHPLPS